MGLHTLVKLFGISTTRKTNFSDASGQLLSICGVCKPISLSHSRGNPWSNFPRPYCRRSLTQQTFAGPFPRALFRKLLGLGCGECLLGSDCREVWSEGPLSVWVRSCYCQLWPSRFRCKLMKRHQIILLGITTLNDVVEDARRITSISKLPLLVDIDTGFGSAFNIARTIRELERVGVAGVHMEDQVAAKRCGHRPGKQIVSTDEMVDRFCKNME